jgi:hypothetical protein
MQTSSPHAAARSPWVAVAVVVGLLQAGCAVCDAHGDCAGDTLCIEGACVDAPAASATVLLPSGPVGDTFEVALELRFRGGEAIVSLERSVDAPGEPCLPLPPLTQRVEGDVDDLVTRVIVIPDVPSLGRSFTLAARVEVNGRTIFVPIPVEGPVPEGVGGITLVTPRRRDIDAIGDALLDIEVQARGITSAWIEPLLPSTAPSSPRALLTTAGDRHTGRVPTIRGPQLLWVEANNGDATVLCGHALVGGPAEVASAELEVLLFSRSVTGDEQLVELSTRITDGGTVRFCEARSGSSEACRARVRANTGPESMDGLLVGVDRGVVEIAAVPRIVSGPVEVQVRVSRGERHLGHFGPITLQPALGEAWVAGRIVIDEAGQLQVSPDAAPPTPGLPW